MVSGRKTECQSWGETPVHPSPFSHSPLPPPPPSLPFSVRTGSVCGPIGYDTGFTGDVSSGCAASAPCCEPSDGPGCVGVPGQPCPPNTPGSYPPTPPGGTGVGTVTL